MKAIEINGNIKTYNRLPKTWKDDNGVHLNFDKVENPQDFGFYDVVMPTYDSVTQQISNLHFDGRKKKFVYDVTDKVFSQTLEQAKENKKSEVKAMAYRLLQPTDWYGIRLAINGISLPQDITDERNEIIRKSDIAEVEIDNLTTIAEVLKYQIVLVEPIDILGSELV
jgi:hypothetical protein